MRCHAPPVDRGLPNVFQEKARSSTSLIAPFALASIRLFEQGGKRAAQGACLAGKWSVLRGKGASRGSVAASSCDPLLFPQCSPREALCRAVDATEPLRKLLC